MKQLLKQYLVAAVLLVPTCLLLAFALQQSNARTKAPMFVLPISAYNPDRLMYGQSLVFQILWPMHHKEPIQCDKAADECCACLRYNGKDKLQPPVISIIPRNAHTKHKCIATLGNLTYYHAAFTEPTTQTKIPSLMAVKNQPERFYISEKDTPAVEKLFQKDPKSLSLQVKIANDTVYVENLLIGGTDYRQIIHPKP